MPYHMQPFEQFAIADLSHYFSSGAANRRSEACMRFLTAIGALAIVVGIAGAAFFFGGDYSVAGTTEDPAAANLDLTRGPTASINPPANRKPPAPSQEAPSS